MNIRPLHDRIIVERLEEETTTAAGIIIPDSAKEKPQQGIVKAVDLEHYAGRRVRVAGLLIEDIPGNAPGLTCRGAVIKSDGHVRVADRYYSPRTDNNAVTAKTDLIFSVDAAGKIRTDQGEGSTRIG